MSLKFAFSLFVCIILKTIAVVKGQELEILLETSHKHGQGVTYNRDLSTAQETTVTRSGKQLCATGLWALFTKPNYGTSNISDVTVYPIKAGSSFECTGSVSIASILRQIQSVRRIAPGDTTVANSVYTEYCLAAYFLRNNANVCSKEPIGITSPPMTSQIKSFAIRGSGHFKLCNDAPKMNCVCLDAGANGPFLVPDLKVWPSRASPFKALTHFSTIEDGECQILPSVSG